MIRCCCYSRPGMHVKVFTISGEKLAGPSCQDLFGFDGQGCKPYQIEFPLERNMQTLQPDQALLSIGTHA